ncbi:hypothetical protein BWK69_01065 [Candidatus Parcubacteria bacterium A4]|nr:MAG: hypothetical protein BWK69_01065 [Candidatus Parcubacteria bacterium A4]
MSTITISEKKIKMVVRESVREAFAQELIKLRALLLPSVSQKEQKNIKKLYNKPSYDTAKSIEIEKGRTGGKSLFAFECLPKSF